LIFEGEFKNLKRDGKGKEFYSNIKVHFKSEFSEGKKWNGKIYYIAGIEDSEIINGTGNIRDYNIYGIKTYEGDIVNGIKQGYGKKIFWRKIRI